MIALAVHSAAKPFDENLSRALSCELSCCDCDHVGPAAETISKDVVGASSRRNRKGPEAIDADGNAGTFWKDIEMMDQRLPAAR